MNNLLYVFITCEVRFPKCYDRIKDMMKLLDLEDYIIIKGGNIQEEYDIESHILNLNCNDFYEGLPEKIIKTFTFLYNSPLFSKYTHFCKIDDDIEIKNLLTDDILFDYCGHLNNNYDGSRGWHIGRCSENSIFNTTEYKGEYVPWCEGGYGYILSKTVLEFIVKETNYYNEIFEDVYIAKILHSNNVFPVHINIKHYLYSKDHL